MGQFVIVISGMGGHGCDRGVKDGESVLGCQRPDCPDCIAREFVRRFKRNNVTELRAEMCHWPTELDDAAVATERSGLHVEKVARYALVSKGQVTDDLVTGIRSGSF